MGFFFRKSIKVFPGIRLNVSSRGVGVSAGIRGARVSLGPRGVYMYGGVGPVRYQKKLGAKVARSTESSASDSSIPSRLHSLEKPRNWHAWSAGILWVLSPMFFQSLGGPELLQKFFAFVWLFGLTGVWIWALLNGPRALKAYRAYKKLDLGTLDPQSASELYARCFSEYPCDFFKLRLAASLLEIGESIKGTNLLVGLANTCSDPIVLVLLGTGYLAVDQPDEALKVLEKCDEPDEYDGYIAVNYLRADCFRKKREFDRALSIIQNYLRRGGEGAVEIHRRLKALRIQVYLDMGDQDAAREEFELLRRQAPNWSGLEELSKFFDKAA